MRRRILDQKLPVPGKSLQKPRIYALGFLPYEVQHGVDLAWVGIDFAVVGDLFCLETTCFAI
ncbi:MAG: hypothetical protein R3C44_10290 [Chloroflexota bacterium]